MSNLSDCWCTPAPLFKELDGVCNFFWDACCDRNNCLVESQKDLLVDDDWEYDYLKADMIEYMRRLYCHETILDKSIFMNPPYSRPSKDNPGINAFIKKAWEDSKHFRVVMLVKADMSTDWFNYPLERPGDPIYAIHINQRKDESIQSVYGRLEKQTQKVDYSHIGVIHLRKRIKFYVSDGIVSKASANFPSMVVVFDRRGK